jgi:hypothetical protein
MSKVRADRYTNRADDGAPTFSQGVNVVGSGVSIGIGASVYSPANNQLVLGTNDSERIRITSGGNVGIASDSPKSIFDVITGAGGGINFAPDGANVPTINFMAGAAKLEQAAQILVGENSGGGDFLIKTKSTAGTLTTRVTVGNNGDATINDGNLVIGTSGHGIDFSATSDATGATSELLDDYEEGSWTPTASSGLTIDSGSWAATGRYVKIGRQVTVEFVQTSGTVSFGAGALILSGLPYNASTGGNGSVGAMTNDTPNISVISLIWTSNRIYAAEAASSQTGLRFAATYQTDG